jgi:hypothetical protein
MIARLVCVTTCLLVVAPAPARASCIPSSSSQRLQRADAVFMGRVLSVSARGDSASFRVLSVRKGRVRKGASIRVTVEPYPSSVTLGWSPRRGQRWRVYTDRNGRRWVTNDCMGTRRL